MASRHTLRRRAPGTCTGCAKRPARPGMKSCTVCTKASRRRYIPLRLALISKYGGHCVACGCSDPVVLTIDHIHDDGNQERRVKTPVQIYKEALQIQRPDLQLLCANCQLRKVNLGPDFTRWGWTQRCVCGILKRGTKHDPD